MQNISISICCLTYNHKKFISDALNSFLKQNTNISYEIIVYDDCSTDGTQDILNKYANEYPDIFRLYLSNSNNYKDDSGRMFIKYLFPHVRGKYVAVCEGDDFWYDPLKLQKQFDAMELNEDCTICFHDAMVCDISGNILQKSQMKMRKYYKNKTCKYSCEEILKLDFYPTASIFFRCSALRDILVPNYFYNRICGDLPIRITLGALGKTYCINETMSIYRVGNPNSASGKVINNYKAINKTLNGHIEILKMFDEWSKNTYHETVLDVISDKEKKRCVMTGDVNGLRKIRKSTSILVKEWIKCYILHYCPSLFRLIRK